MNKPIFIVRFPKNTEIQKMQTAAENMQIMGVNEDYHVLIVRDEFTGGEMKFECFNAPHTDIEFEELKEKVFKIIQNQ